MATVNSLGNDPGPISAVLGQDPQALQCPFGHYAEQRRTAPVAHDAEHDVYVVTRHDDIVSVLKRPDLFSNRNPMGPSVEKAFGVVQSALEGASPDFIERVRVAMSHGDVLFTQDPPVHGRHRRVLGKSITPSSVARLEPVIRRLCNDLVDAFIADGEADLVPAFIAPFPIQVLSTMLGVPVEMHRDFARWAHAINSHVGADVRRAELMATLEDQVEFWAYFEQALADRKESPRDDLLTAVVQARNEGEEPLTLNEMVGFCAQLVAAGADTTTKLISSFALMLLRDPELMRLLRADQALLPDAIEEALRLESPIQGLFRIATSDTELHGVKIPAGAYVWLVYGAANRDDEVFTNPDQFDSTRPELRSHLALGKGIHACLGAPLARVEARIAFEVIFSRFEEIRLADQDFEPAYDAGYITRGIESLPVVFTAKD
ncbi:cytochrome P450 [Streptomyces muensis]|uniref:Cytochrome P450 n=1 Tax=Streptomyces muensis TaxID=1077944 RepID=A0A9X1PWC5_STRM4|nr:cytochrome P450 [Streptomyces muensis]MCF1592521.1 cytochrome P450 [Streptomyces muensis]